MQLFIHTELRKILRNVLVSFLVIAAARVAFGDPFPTPQILSVTGQCPETVMTWASSGQTVPFYLVIVMGPQGPQTQLVFGTRLSLFELTPGDYTAMVKAGSFDGNDSAFSDPYAFTIRPCVRCVEPSVQLTHADPTTLWPPNGRNVPVNISGQVLGVSAECPLRQARYKLLDSQGDPRDGRVSVSADGHFTLQVFMTARRLGGENAGRVYTLTVTAETEAGTGTSNPVRVEVPHDQGR